MTRTRKDRALKRRQKQARIIDHLTRLPREFVKLEMQEIQRKIEEDRVRNICRLCGRPATGLATIGEYRYCHGDEDPEPTCYEMAQWAQSNMLGPETPPL